MKMGLVFKIQMFLIVFFLVFSNTYAEEAKDVEDLAKETWDLVLKEIGKKSVPFKTKIALIKEFIAKSPEQSKSNNEAKNLLKECGDSESKIYHFMNRDSYINKTEWFATGFVGGNYGLGLTMSFATFRWKRFFWESMRIQFTMLLPIGSHALNGKTMMGVPFFYGFANQHELRLSTGITGGLSVHEYLFPKPEKGNDYSGLITVGISIPIEISYVFHIDKFFAFQIGLILDMPVYYEYSERNHYIPSLSSFIGFRI